MGLAGKKGGTGLVDTARALDPKDLDVLSDTVEKQAPKYSLDAAGQARALREMIAMADRNPGYFLVLKRIKDLAKQYLEATHAALRSDMRDAEFAKVVAYNAGAWQALTQLGFVLNPVELKKTLDALEQGMHRMGA